MAADPREYVPETPGRRFTIGLVAAALVVSVVAATLVVVGRVRTRHEAERRAADAQKGRPVTVVPVGRGPEQRTLQLPGEIHGYTETPVYAKIAGYLGHIFVDKGDRVTGGQVLAVLEAPELDQQVRNAEASYRLKRATDARFEVLRKQGVVSQQDADQAQADYVQAEATLRELQAMQEYKRITADFDGIVTARYADPGTLVPQATSGNLGANTPIVAVASLDPLRVYVDLPQSAAPSIRDGAPAVVTVSEYPGRRFEGTVTRHPLALATATRTMLVEVDLSNGDRALFPGMYAQVALEVRAPASAPRVPDDALIFRDGKTFVAVVEGDRLRLAQLALGYDDGRESEVADGLKGDERIAVNVGQTARDGELVQVHERGEPVERAGR